MYGASHMSSGNIAPSEQRKRLIFGVLALTAGITWVIMGRADSLSGVMVVFILFWFGALGVLQAKEKT